MLRRFVVFVSGFAALLGGLCGVLCVSPAVADETGSIHVHKYKGAPDASLKHDGTEQSVSGRDPLEGIDFDVYEVKGLDLKKNDDVKVASQIGQMKLTAAQVAGGKITVGGTDYVLEKKSSAKTGADGKADFAPLTGYRVYVVNENLTASAPVGVDKSQITPSAPFTVNLPFTVKDGDNAGKTKQVFDVHVYPKNAVNTFTKAVEDAGLGVGGEFKYTLSATPVITDTDGDGKVDAADLGGWFSFKDRLPENVSYKSAEVSVKGVKAQADADYTVDTATAGTVEIKFTPAGIAKVAAGGEVKAVVTAVFARTAENGLTENEAEFFPNKYTHDQGRGVKSNKVVTKHGDIVVHKTGAAGADLAGAEFEIHRATGSDCAAGYGERIGEVQTSDAKGLVKFSGLQLSDWADGKSVEAGQVKPYCVKEVKAPSGYQLLPEPVAVKLTKEGMVEVTPGTTDWAGLTSGGQNAKVAVGKNGVTVENYRNSALPLTGAAGITLLSLAGLIVLSAGVYAAGGFRRKEKKTA